MQTSPPRRPRWVRLPDISETSESPVQQPRVSECDIACLPAVPLAGPLAGGHIEAKLNQQRRRRLALQGLWGSRPQR